jgi:predicted kinase
MLIVFAGLPATGKTTLARELARQLKAVHLRIDTIECALREGLPDGVPVGELGYRVAYALAEDNLRLGRRVIADSVNPLAITRKAWHGVAHRAGATLADVEVICSDRHEHQRRVETRIADIAGHQLPTWAEVLGREYHEWTTPRIVVDTAGKPIERTLSELGALVAAAGGSA